MSFRTARGVRAWGVLFVASAAFAMSGCGSSGSITTAPTSSVVEAAPGSTAVSAETSTSATSSPTTATATTVSPSTTAAANPPQVPTGSFLSSHELPLSGANGTPNAQSVCRTSPGASCQIHFTMGAVTRSLPAQNVDSDGMTSWYWSPSQVGLTAGHWDVTIVASAGGRQSSVDDALGLTVVP